MGKICFVFNQAPKYVEASYILFDRTFDISWCFGTVEDGIKEMDHSLLKKVKVYQTVNSRIKSFYKLKGIEEVAKNKDYDAYILIGDFRMSSMWKLPYLIKLHNRKAKIIFWTHGWYGRESKVKVLIKKMFFAPADDILLYGNYAKDLMIQNGFKEKKLHVIHNSLDHSAQLTLRNSLKKSDILLSHFNNNNPVLVVIGRLTERKKLDMLIESLAILKNKGKCYNALIIGDGPARKQLEKMVVAKSLKDSVWFYGECFDEQTNAELLFNSDLCIVPGDIGLTAIHALTFGVPTITHDCYIFQGPEFEAIKEGETGAFYKHNDIQSLVATISKWFSKPSYDREAIRNLCYEEIDNYWTPEYELDILKKVLNQ